MYTLLLLFPVLVVVNDNNIVSCCYKDFFSHSSHPSVYARLRTLVTWLRGTMTAGDRGTTSFIDTHVS